MMKQKGLPVLNMSNHQANTRQEWCHQNQQDMMAWKPMERAWKKVVETFLPIFPRPVLQIRSAEAAKHWHNRMPSTEVWLNRIFGELIMTTNEITYYDYGMQLLAHRINAHSQWSVVLTIREEHPNPVLQWNGLSEFFSEMISKVCLLSHQLNVMQGNCFCISKQFPLSNWIMINLDILIWLKF